MQLLNLPSEGNCTREESQYALSTASIGSGLVPHIGLELPPEHTMGPGLRRQATDEKRAHGGPDHRGCRS